MKYIAIILIIASCDTEVRIDSDLEKFVNEFYYQANERGKKYPRITSVQLSDNISVVGKYDRSEQTVLMNKSWVVTKLNVGEYHDNFIMLAVFHELGHSVGQKHRGGLSIMNTVPDFGQCLCGDWVLMARHYNEHPEDRKEIIDELFNDN